MIAGSRPQWSEDCDIAIIGGGIGLCIAWPLAEAGEQAIVIDDRNAGSTADAGSLHVQMPSRFIRLFPIWRCRAIRPELYQPG
jgi:glycine/D-amino acid oxidase-like deaminating enzyme